MYKNGWHNVAKARKKRRSTIQFPSFISLTFSLAPLLSVYPGWFLQDEKQTCNFFFTLFERKEKRREKKIIHIVIFIYTLEQYEEKINVEKERTLLRSELCLFFLFQQERQSLRITIFPVYHSPSQQQAQHRVNRRELKEETKSGDLTESGGVWV